MKIAQAKVPFAVASAFKGSIVAKIASKYSLGERQIAISQPEALARGNFAGPSLTYRVRIGSFQSAARPTRFPGKPLLAEMQSVFSRLHWIEDRYGPCKI
jgi:hypothetical protein